MESSEEQRHLFSIFEVKYTICWEQKNVLENHESNENETIIETCLFSMLFVYLREAGSRNEVIVRHFLWSPFLNAGAGFAPLHSIIGSLTDVIIT